MNLEIGCQKLFNLNREKRGSKKHEQSLGNPWVNNKNSKNQINGIQEGEQEECYIEKLMTKNTPSFREKNINLQIQEDEQTPYRIYTKESMPRYIIIKC